MTYVPMRLQIAAALILMVSWSCPADASQDPPLGYETASLYLSLPTLGYATREEASQVGWVNQVLAFYQRNRPIIDESQYLNFLFATQPKAARRHTTNIAGCDGYLSDGHRSDIYICKAAGSRDDIVVTCSSDGEDVPFPSCDVSRKLNDRDTVKYDFPRSYLNRVADIDERTAEIGVHVFDSLPTR